MFFNKTNLKNIAFACCLFGMIFQCNFVSAAKIDVPQNKSQIILKLMDSPFSIHIYHSTDLVPDNIYYPKNLIHEKATIAYILTGTKDKDYFVTKDGMRFDIVAMGIPLLYDIGWDLYKINSNPENRANRGLTSYESPISLKGYVYNNKTYMETSHAFYITILPIVDRLNKNMFCVVSGIIEGDSSSVNVPETVEFSLMVYACYRTQAELDTISDTEKENAIIRNDIIPAIKNIQISMDC